jgi:hypothetical protein
LPLFPLVVILSDRHEKQTVGNPACFGIQLPPRAFLKLLEFANPRRQKCEVARLLFRRRFRRNSSPFRGRRVLVPEGTLRIARRFRDCRKRVLRFVPEGRRNGALKGQKTSRNQGTVNSGFLFSGTDPFMGKGSFHPLIALAVTVQPCQRRDESCRLGTRWGGIRLQICLRMVNLDLAGWGGILFSSLLNGRFKPFRPVCLITPCGMPGWIGQRQI